MKISKIEIVFENVEVIKVPFEAIENIQLSNITENINTCYGLDVIKMKIARDLWLVLNEKAFNLQSNYSECFKKEEDYTLNRILKHKDITSIHIYYDDKTNEQIYVLWGGEDDYSNIYQKSEIREHELRNGTEKLLAISVSEKDIDLDKISEE